MGDDAVVARSKLAYMETRMQELERKNALLESELATLRAQKSDAGNGATSSSTSFGLEVRRNGLFARMHLLHLTDYVIDYIPKNLSVVLEIGASDRDTMDVELLPRRPYSFLITAEPVIDKYARALARNINGRGDAHQFLGQHNPRGLALPIAIGPSNMAGVQKLNLQRNSGCSSLLPVDRTSNRVRFCRMPAEVREVPTVTLETLLGWVNRTVEFVKIDAQGLDLSIIQSAGARLSQVQAFQLEVNSDDCDAIYKARSGPSPCYIFAGTLLGCS